MQFPCVTQLLHPSMDAIDSLAVRIWTMAWCCTACLQLHRALQSSSELHANSIRPLARLQVACVRCSFVHVNHTSLGAATEASVQLRPQCCGMDDLGGSSQGV